MILAALLGVLLMTALVGLIILISIVRPTPPSAEDLASPAPWAILGAVFLAFVPLHELLHLIWHPHGGLSERSWIVVWPARLKVGVYFQGILSRSRWLAMRAAPFLFLSLVPAVIVLAFPRLDLAIGSALSFLMVLNTLGSGGDALAILLVLPQVPSSGILQFDDGRARWGNA